MSGGGQQSNGYDFEEWRDFARPFFDVIPKCEQASYCADATINKLGRLVIADVWFDAAIFDRDPGKLRGFDTEFLLLETYDKGENIGRGGDLVTALGARSVHIYDMAQPWRTQTTAVECRSVVIPYDAIGYDPSRQSAYARLSAGSPQNAMLLAAMGSMFDAGSCLTQEDQNALAESFCAIVRRLMFNEGDRDREYEQAEGASLFLRRYIEEHLDEPDLDLQRLCSALRLSRSTLYRMLPDQGGIYGYITARRLERCFDELRRGPPIRGRVRQVAEGWGFFDAKSFNRAFRARFGVAPSDCLDRPLDVEPDIVDRHPINDWMSHL